MICSKLCPQTYGLDFLEFEMKPMSDGECDESNALAIKGPNAKHSKLICGTINKVS